MTFVPVETLEQVVAVALSESTAAMHQTTHWADPGGVGPLNNA